MGILFGEEQAGRGAIHESAMLVLLVEVAAARRKQGQLPAQSWWGEGDPPGQGGWRDEDPPGDAVLLTPVPMGPPGPRGTQPPAETLPLQPDLARDLFEPQINEQLEPELRSGLYGIGDGRERGKRPRIGIS